MEETMEDLGQQIRDAIEDNESTIIVVVAFLAMVVISMGIDLVLLKHITTYGIASINLPTLACMLVWLLVARERKDALQLAVWLEKDKAKAYDSSLDDAKLKIDVLQARIGQYQTTENSWSTENERLANEVRTLRADMQRIAGKYQTLQQEKRTVEQELSNATTAITNASQAVSKRIEQAVANATKPLQAQIERLQPYQELYALGIEDAKLKGIINTNTGKNIPPQEVKDKAGERRGEIKEEVKVIKQTIDTWEERRNQK